MYSVQDIYRVMSLCIEKYRNLYRYMRLNIGLKFNWTGSLSFKSLFKNNFNVVWALAFNVVSILAFSADIKISSCIWCCFLVRYAVKNSIRTVVSDRSRTATLQH